MKGTAIVAIRQRGAKQASREIAAKGAVIRRVMLSEFRGRYKRELEAAVVAEAPHGKKPSSVKPGPRLRETIEVKVAARPGEIWATATSNAVDPRSGYHYTGVTRYGHKVAVIRPKKSGRGYLRFYSPRHGHIITKGETKGVKHAEDWVAGAMPAAGVAADAAAERIGRRIVTTR